MAENENIEFQNDQITVDSHTDAETQYHVEIKSYTCQPVSTEPITITTTQTLPRCNFNCRKQF